MTDLMNNKEEGERLVLNIIQEYLGKNRFFELEKIIPIIVSRFGKKKININTTGIIAILESFLKNHIIVERSKLLRENILQNSTRKKIDDFIKNNSGVYFNLLVKKLNITPPVVEWHLNILLKFNLIKKKKIDNHKVYYNANFNPRDIKELYFLSKDKSRQIIDYFKKNNKHKITKSYLSNTLKIHYNIISKYIDNLEKIGVLKKEKMTNKSIYRLNEGY